MLVAITGGAGALGSTLAKHLSGLGFEIALFDIPSARGRLDEVAKDVGGRAFTGDFSSREAWTTALASLGSAPTHAALIAGGFAGGKPLYESDDEVYTKMMKQNVDTAYFALRSLLPGMVARKNGSVVLVGSRAATRPWTSAGSAAYAGSKGAVVTMAEAAAAEVLEHGVRINCVLPSTMDTRANRSAMPSADASKWVSLESASKVISFLLSEDAKDITGAALPVYGRA